MNEENNSAPPAAHTVTSYDDDLQFLMRRIAEMGGVYASHIRSEGEHLLQAIAEIIEVCEMAEIPVQIAHFKTGRPSVWDHLDIAIAMIDDARKRGLDVTADRYPYCAWHGGSTNITPRWASGEKAKRGGWQHMKDPDIVDRFRADVQAHQKKVYQVLYGNPKARPQPSQSDLRVKQQEGLGQTVETTHYRIGLSTNSGAVETVTVLGEDKPVLLEHKLETNGAVHWNPGCYAPPTPWVHASDWEKPEFKQISALVRESEPSD